MDTQRSLRRYHIFGVVSLFLLVGVMGGWAYTASIAGAIIAQGKVVVESNSKAVQHLEGGIVDELKVRNGDNVLAGQVLIRLDDTESHAALEIINTQLYELLIRKARLEAERDLAADIIFSKELTELVDIDWILRSMAAQRNLLVARRDFMNGQIELLSNRKTQLREEIIGLNAQLAAKTRQTDLLNEELLGLEQLKKDGLVTVSRLMTLERQNASLEGERGQLIADMARVRARIGETELEIIQIKQDAQTKVLEELRELQPKLAEAYERRLPAQAKLRRNDIVAPRSGFVHELQVNGEGSVINSGQVIMLIVPGKDVLVLEAQVNAQDIDQISVGQQVMVNFPAFASGVTPSLVGNVYRIAADLTQTDNQNEPPHYSVRIELKQGELEKLGDQKLKPGMPAETHIQTATRSALSYFLKPFTDQLNRAFRER